MVQKCKFELSGVRESIVQGILELAKRYATLFNDNSLMAVQLGTGADLDALSSSFCDHIKFLYAFYDTSYAINRAESNNADFEWSEEHFSRDSNLFHKLGDSIPNVIEYYKNELDEDRFNVDKVERLYRYDSFYELLLSIARYGAIIDVDPDFVVNPVGDLEFRILHKRLMKCYAQHAVHLWSQHRGLLFRVEDIGDTNLTIHKSPAHWFPKPVELNAAGVDVNVDGRFLLDLSNVSNPAVQVNGGQGKELAIDRYGKVYLIKDTELFISMMFHVAALGLLWGECFTWKLDVKGAFPRFNFNKESALLLGVFVAVGILFIYTHGMFGWTGWPSVFQVIGMALLRWIRRESLGLVNLYIDDFMGFGTLPQCIHDQALAVDCT